MSRVLSVSTSRADIGILLPVWRALVERRCTLHVFLTGMHRMPSSDLPAGPPGVSIESGGADLGGESETAAAAMAAIAGDAGACYAKVAPDAVLVTGDRLDMLPAAVAALPFNIPLVHLHGGEVTEGAIDDRVRHAVTKLAHLHCVSSQGARARLVAMGEEDWRIHVTGAPGLDTLLAAPVIGVSDFATALGLPEMAGLRLVTVHPETNAAEPLAALDAVLGALASRPAPTLITAPNSDPGGAEARRRIDAFLARHRWALFRDTLGPVRYPQALRLAAVMIGNSSSGLIEAGLFGLPVIDVGGRQAGRERGANVINVPAAAAAVGRVLDRLGPTPARLAPGTPYGDGRSGPRVAAAILDTIDGAIRRPRAAVGDMAG